MTGPSALALKFSQTAFNRSESTRLGRKFARRLLMESLEPRTLLTADIGWAPSLSMEELSKLSETDKSSVVPTHFYSADGQAHGMVILSDRLAIRLSNPSSQPSNSQSAGLQQESVLADFGLSELRPLDGNFSVYASAQPITDHLIHSLTENGVVEKIVPVFGMLQSQSEAVLLNEVIIGLPQGVEATEYFAQSTFTGYRPLDGTPDQFVATLSGGYGERALAAINEISGDSQVSWTSPNFYQNWQRFQFFPNDPRFGNQWHLHNTGQGGGLVDADPNLPEAWQFFQPGGPPNSIVVGVVDDGVATNHPDILNWVNVGETAGDGQDNDGNGWIDDLNGWNFVDNNNISAPTTSSDNHGTAVAGVAAARGNNGIGVTGASYNSPVISSRIFRGSAVALDASIASSIYYTAGRTQNGLGTWPAAHIVNHSWGGGGVSSAITGAVTWATTQGRGGLGVPQLFAAGNSFGSVIYPATLSLSNPGVIAVGAMNNFGEKSNFSSFGPAVDLVTPSNDLRAGYLAIDTTDRVAPSGYSSSSNYTGTGATGFGGTSSAAPLATGIGALALARAEQMSVNLTAADLKALMKNNTKLAGSTAYGLSTGRNDLMGNGLLNAETLIKGIGRAQVSVTTANQVLDTGGTIDFGSSIVGGVQEVTFRVRNQGTSPLNLTGLSVSSADYSISQEPGSTQLALGESTTFVVRFNPFTAGVRTGTVTLQSNDSQRPALVFDVTGLAQANTISGFFFEDRDGNGVFDAGESPLAAQTIFIDQNGNGIFDSNIESLHQTNSTSAPIIDFQTTSSVINVSNMDSSVTDVNVTVNLTHTFLGDLTIALVAPDGTRVLLFNRRGGGGDNLVNTVFADQADQPISAGSAPFSGSFRPEQPLSLLNFRNPNGAWTLEIRDNAGADQGTLNNWTLSLVGGERIANTDEFGFYYFLDLPNGSYSAIGLIPSGWTGSGSNQYPFTVSSPSDSFTNRNIGLGKNDRFYARAFEDLNGDGAVNANEGGLGGQWIFLDANSNGIFDPPNEANLTNSASTPLNDNTTINLPIVVSGLQGTLADVDVSLNLNHTWVGDLEISLFSPSGTQVMLSNRNGSSGDNYTNTRFDDDASESILEGSPPYTGSFRPEAPLSQLNDQIANGTWILRIRDLANGDTGTFLNWTLHLKTLTDIVAETDSNGWASFDLPPGTSSIALIPQPGWEFTVPTDGLRQASAGGVPLFNQLYGTREPVEGILDSFVYHDGWTGSGSAIDGVKSLAKESIQPQTLTFDNLISSEGGIKGVGFELQSVPGTLSASDFVFQVSPTGAFDEGLNPPTGWAAAPAPIAIDVTSGATDQVLVRWASNAIANRWMRITMLDNANTGLSEPEVYYVGHLLGETTGPSGGVFSVTFADITPIRTEIGQTVNASSIVDIDKNGSVAFADISAMRANIGQQLTIITVPGTLSSPPKLPGGKLNGSEDGSGKLPESILAAPQVISDRLMALDSKYSNVIGPDSRVDRDPSVVIAQSSIASDIIRPLDNSNRLPTVREPAMESSELAASGLSSSIGPLKAIDDYFAELSVEDSLR